MTLNLCADLSTISAGSVVEVVMLLEVEVEYFYTEVEFVYYIAKKVSKVKLWAYLVLLTLQSDVPRVKLIISLKKLSISIVFKETCPVALAQ